MSPTLETIATLEFDDCQAAAFVTDWVEPFERWAVAVSWLVWPTRVKDGPVIATDVTVAGPDGAVGPGGPPSELDDPQAEIVKCERTAKPAKDSVFARVNGVVIATRD